MQVSSAALRKGTSDFRNWWFGELSALIPAPLRRALNSVPRSIAITFDGDEILLSKFDGGDSEQIGRFPFDGGTSATVRPDLNRLLAQYPAKHWRWGLYLGGEAVLNESLRLPVAAEENYFEAVEFQIDRRTPFQRNEVYFDCRPVAGSQAGGSFSVEYVVAPRLRVDTALRRLTAIGIPVDFVTATSDLSGAQIPFNLLPDHDMRHRQQGYGLNAALAVLAVLLGVLAVYLSLDYDRRYADALAVQVDQLRNEARVVSQLRAQFSSESRNVNAVLDLKRERASVSRILNDLSALLPDDTWVSRFTYKKGTAQIVVHAPESASIVGLIEGSDRFSGAKMMTAVRRLKNENRERFTLGFSIGKGDRP